LIIYVDTSAVLKLVVEEKESTAAAKYLSTAAARGDKLVASMLLYTEPHGAAHGRGFPCGLVNAVLSGINLLDLVRSDLMYAAGRRGGRPPQRTVPGHQLRGHQRHFPWRRGLNERYSEGSDFSSTGCL
jgi:hypothetical protein